MPIFFLFVAADKGFLRRLGFFTSLLAFCSLLYQRENRNYDLNHKANNFIENSKVKMLKLIGEWNGWFYFYIRIVMLEMVITFYYFSQFLIFNQFRICFYINSKQLAIRDRQVAKVTTKQSHKGRVGFIISFIYLFIWFLRVEDIYCSKKLEFYGIINFDDKMFVSFPFGGEGNRQGTSV